MEVFRIKNDFFSIPNYLYNIVLTSSTIMDISVIPNWLGNSTNIENALSHSWLITISNILVALGTIVLAYYTYKLARSNDLTVKNSQNQLEELKKQYSISNLREKGSCPQVIEPEL
jgi:hypothetical protein